MKHPVAWHTAAPLWDLALDTAGAGASRFLRPEILRFKRDEFMDELQSLLAENPAELADRVVRAETWQQEAVGWSQHDQPEPVDLFQPVHQRFYLVAASLVCRLPGLPDRVADPSREKLAFVMRRLAPADPELDVDPEDPETFVEQAWVGDRRRGRWVDVPGGEVLVGEERLPLFPLAFEHEGMSRRLLAGLLPVAGRELYEGAGGPPTPGADGAVDAGSARGAVYQARCVYERAACSAFEPPVLSRPTRPFRMASFFDPDAPVRPVSIRLPIDTTTTGLRAFGKGVSFMLSNQLRRQMARLEGQSIEQLEDGDQKPDPGAFNLGVIWTFSIPIITLCAFILLMVIVNLLNFVFQWLPFFRIVLPLNLKVET